MDKPLFYCCEKCKRPLIARTENGLFHLKFGKFDKDSKEVYSTPIEIKFYGSIKMRCWRHSCRKKYPLHWNIFNYFPFSPKETSSRENKIGITEYESVNKPNLRNED